MCVEHTLMDPNYTALSIWIYAKSKIKGKIEASTVEGVLTNSVMGLWQTDGSYKFILYESYRLELPAAINAWWDRLEIMVLL